MTFGVHSADGGGSDLSLFAHEKFVAGKDGLQCAVNRGREIIQLWKKMKPFRTRGR